MKILFQISFMIFILPTIGCTEEWKIKKKIIPSKNSNVVQESLSGSSQKQVRISGTISEPSTHLSGSAPPLSGSVNPPHISGG